MQEWSISGALRPSPVTAEHIFGHAISSLQLRAAIGALSLIQQTGSIISRAEYGGHPLPLARKIKHISFHSYFISWLAILCVLCGRDEARDLKGHDVKDPVFMWGFHANVRATASKMTKLGCEVKNLFELLVNTIKTKGWGTQTKVLKCRKALAVTSYIMTKYPEDQWHFLYWRYWILVILTCWAKYWCFHILCKGYMFSLDWYRAPEEFNWRLQIAWRYERKHKLIDCLCILAL